MAAGRHWYCAVVAIDFRSRLAIQREADAALHHPGTRDVFRNVGQNLIRDGGRILRPVLWFGLLEHRSEKIAESRFGEHHFYRKTSLFDRMLTFDVAVDSMEGARH